ncbi:YesN/AraC family two-component response regulator [Kordia periserrulae]|uniref:YesN/AraC family two-component response regulator n=1 Tax=Kordia periserrulae TaxID=701523 RepID=A0A2T6BW51_9FLAO|nr:helix-turn-helix domain-containing protein [Kordia periserrulae]PTX60197.1 YesN/AraC family two-component response regulator [Kordia periserrulae]
MKHLVCTLLYFLTKTRCFSVLCVLFLLSNVSIAQENYTVNDTIVSEEIRLLITTSDALETIEEMIQHTFAVEKDTLSGLAYCQLYLERGRKEADDSIQFFANFQMAYISFYQPNYKEALKRSYISARIAERMKDTINSISSNVLLGSSWYVLGVYDEALKPYLIAKEFSTDTQNTSYEIICLTNIANIRAKLNRYENALDSYNSILAILDTKEQPLSVQDTATLLSSLLGKVLCLSELKRFEEAEVTYKKGVAIAEKNDFEIFKSRFNVNLGKVYYEKGEYFKSLGYLREGKKVLKEAGLQNNLYITDFYIAQNLAKLEQYDEAIRLLDAIFKRAGDDTYTDRIEEMYALAIQISKSQQQKEKELFYLRESQNIIKKLTEKQLAAKDLLYEDDMKAYELENEKLTHENTENLADKKVITTVSVILVSLLLLALLFFYRKAKLKEQKFLAIIEDISTKTSAQKSPKEITTSTIEDEKSQTILEQLSALEATHFYLSEDASLHNTAKLLNTNTSYLSKALNTIKKQSFSQYVNKLRIDYVLVKLKEDAVFRSYTIHAISKEIGYKSATTFIKEFKNKTGLNPSYYIKKIDS